MAKNQSYSFDKIEDTLSSNEFVNQGRGSESRGSKSSGPVEIGVAGVVLFLLLTLALCFATGFVVYFLRPDARCNVTSSECSALLVLALGHVRELLAKRTVWKLELLLALLLDLLCHVLFVII